ncbi:hypothetical protein Tco_1484344 [Tanacetum coccineum]
MSETQDEIPPPPPPPATQQTPTQQTPHTVSTIKLPILKKGEYDIWAMKMEHYLAHTDYPIWENATTATNRWHFARECRTKEDNRRRDGWNPGNKDGSRTGKKEESKAL